MTDDRLRHGKCVTIGEIACVRTISPRMMLTYLVKINRPIVVVA